MAFAILYNREDLTPIAAELNNTNMVASTQEKNLARAIWNGGLKDWSTAPTALSHPDPRVQALAGGDSDCRYVVITASFQGSAVTGQQMRDLLYSVAAQNPGASYLVGIANDMGGVGVVEPWPMP